MPRPQSTTFSLVVPDGSVTGLLGPNGAGKSSTFKCLLGLNRPTSGTITVGGAPVGPATFETLAYVPERSALLEWLSVGDHMEIVRRTNARFDLKRASELAATFKLNSKKKLGRLSKGQQTAVALALAFAIRPSVLVLDEPASGLDPIFQRVVLDLIVDAAAGGATILFSSHQIGQVERAVDRVAILNNGRLVLSGDVDDLKGSEKVVEAIFAGDAPPLYELANDARVRRIVSSGRILRVYARTEPQAIAQLLEAYAPKTVDILDLGTRRHLSRRRWRSAGRSNDRSRLMVYLEYLRARRAFLWYAAAIIVIVAFIISGAAIGNSVSLNGHVSGDTGSSDVHVHGLSSLGRVPIPIEGLVGTAAMLALFFATVLASSFNRDSQYAHFLFTRPVSRYRTAALTIGVDFAAILAAAVFALAFALLAAAASLREHADFIWSADTIGTAVLGIGAAFAWYGVLQAFSAWTTRRAGIFVGIGAALLGLAIPFSRISLLGPVQYFFKAVLFIDPIAYFTSVTMTSGGDVSVGGQFATSLAVRATAVWILAPVSLTIATLCWKRVEI